MRPCSRFETALGVAGSSAHAESGGGCKSRGRGRLGDGTSTMYVRRCCLCGFESQVGVCRAGGRRTTTTTTRITMLNWRIQRVEKRTARAGGHELLDMQAWAGVGSHQSSPEPCNSERAESREQRHPWTCTRTDRVWGAISCTLPCGLSVACLRGGGHLGRDYIVYAIYRVE